MSSKADQPKQQASIPSADILGAKSDQCLANAVVKTGLGLGVGVVLSAVLFRRRAFPIWLLSGAGLGSAYTECQISFNPAAVPGYRIANSNETVSVAATAAAPRP